MMVICTLSLRRFNDFLNFHKLCISYKAIFLFCFPSFESFIFRNLIANCIKTRRLHFHTALYHLSPYLAFLIGQLTTIYMTYGYIMSKNSGIMRLLTRIPYTYLHNIVRINCDHGEIAVSIITISGDYIKRGYLHKTNYFTLKYFLRQYINAVN